MTLSSNLKLKNYQIILFFKTVNSVTNQKKKNGHKLLQSLQISKLIT